MADEVDFVSPAYARHPLDGALVTQLVRPLFRAAYGLALREPLAGEFACSGRFAARCLEHGAWDSDAPARWGSTSGSRRSRRRGPCRVAEARLGPRQLAPRPRPGVSALVPQVLDALFTCLRLDEATWTARDGTAPLALYGESAPTPPHAGGGRSSPREPPLFREGVAALEPILARALGPETLAAVKRASATRPACVPDELWLTVVLELAAAHRRAQVSRDHLVQAAVPLYLGRVAAFHATSASDSPGRRGAKLEELCLRFERSRPELVALWTAAAR